MSQPSTSTSTSTSTSISSSSSSTSPLTSLSLSIPILTAPNTFTLDRSQFTSTLPLIALRVPASQCSTYLKIIPKNLIFHRRSQSAVVDDDDVVDGVTSKTTKLILLCETIKDTSLTGVPPAIITQIHDLGATPIHYSFQLTFQHYSHEDILRRYLPADVNVPASFETIGHIAHLNLTEQQLPYKYIIGQVLREKLPNIRTVVNKLDNISNQFRVFPMELLAGDDDYMTEVREHNILFCFDFSKVYWNSRLQTEHQRLVQLFQPKQCICDMFCGIGPFALPAAKLKQCRVYANDLNPESYHYLQQNIKRAKLSSLISPFNLDARVFIRLVAARQLEGSIPIIHHIIMNLPADATQFTDVFHGLYTYQQQHQPAHDSTSTAPSTSPSASSSDEKQAHSASIPFSSSSSSSSSSPARVCELRAGLPLVHCYGFTHQGGEALIQRVESVFGCPLDSPSVYNVRNVAPNKEMWCVSFRLPERVAFAEAPPKRVHNDTNIHEAMTNHHHITAQTSTSTSTSNTDSFPSPSPSLAETSKSNCTRTPARMDVDNHSSHNKRKLSKTDDAVTVTESKDNELSAEGDAETVAEPEAIKKHKI